VSIATTEVWKDKNGEKQERTEWHRVAFFGRLAEIAGEYLKKGSPVYIEGSLRTRKWQDKDGQDRYTTEIVASDMKMLGSRASGTEPMARDSAPAASEGGGAAKPQGRKGGAFDEMDDDIPF